MTDVTGEIEIPRAPKRILAVDEYAALSMLTVGAEPDLTYLVFSDEVSRQIFEHTGITTRAEADFLAEPSFETIAADAPDLIVASDAGPLASRLDRLKEIAPTVALPFSQGWRTSVERTAAIFDTDSEPVISAVLDRIEKLSTQAEGHSVSMLLDYGTGPQFPTPNAPMALLLDEVGFTRPAAQRDSSGANAGEFIVPVSPERLPDHDADYIALLDGASYNAKAVRRQELFGALHGAATDVNGTAWFGNSAFNMWWVLDDLQAMLTHTAAQTISDTTRVWDDYATTALENK